MKNLNRESVILSLDVESMGLYGLPFSYGYKLATLNNEVIEEKYVFSSLDLAEAYKWAKLDITSEESKSFSWVVTNVISVAGDTNTDLPIHKCFINDWIRIKLNYPDVVLLADSPHPVETSLLYESLLQTSHRTNGDSLIQLSPYPLLDLTSMRMAHKLDPYFDRREDELPIHHPLMDARQTFRGLRELLEY